MDTIDRIRALPKSISDKIAAGEVVERPLSVVKELVENAIDAQAEEVVVEIRKGGKSYIRVSDDGIGIPPEDVELVFMRHATSKIASEDDLNAIETLGFRGEALASIAAVSRVELITKRADEQAGMQAVTEGGHSLNLEKIGAEKGTTVVVSDLFYNTPARKKFLKTDRSESAAVVDYVSRMALGYPSVRFRMVRDGSILFSTRGRGDSFEAIHTVYSKQTVKALLPVEAAGTDDGIAVTGWISRPDQTRPNRRYQIYFVNGRWVRSKLLDDAVQRAYIDKLEKGRFPAAFLFLSVPAALVDVNIHPHKTEVRFHDDSGVEAFVTEALRSALLALHSAPSVETRFVSTQPERERQGSLSAGDMQAVQVSKEKTESETANAAVDVKYISLTSETDRFSQMLSEHRATSAFDSYDGGVQEEWTAPERFLFSSLRIVGSLFGGYIAAEGDDTLILIDQHAAHERVLYERALQAHRDKECADKQEMMQPWVLETDVASLERAQVRLTLLDDLGYDVEEFGSQAWIVRAIPAYMEALEARRFIETVLSGEDAGESPHDADRLITRACRQAVKVTKRLSVPEIRELFALLDACDNPFTCPHGRPTFLRLSHKDLEKMFQRT